MTKNKVYQQLHALLLLFVLMTSCNGQEKPKLSEGNQQTTKSVPSPLLDTAQISDYVINLFEDSKGNLWFGTISDGVARYDGKTLTYFTTKDGLCDNTVVSMVEDKKGHLWFGTRGGLSKYDGKIFTNFTSKQGLCDDRVSRILIDRNGNLWVGTWGGVCRFNGSTFSNFPLPKPDIDVPSYQATTNWVTKIMEDKQGNLWFGRSGYGACKYDGKSFTQFTKKEGLPSNCVQNIVEDKKGNIWFGTRVAEKDHSDADKRTGGGGLSRYDGKTFTQYPEIEGLSKNDIYAIYEDKKGNLWMGATGLGVYRYDGQSFTLYKGTDRMDLTWHIGIQSILEDRNGTLWFGFSGGLFRFNGTVMTNVAKGGL
jgi:ligand-binding sensor domain-containing protein